MKRKKGKRYRIKKFTNKMQAKLLLVFCVLTIGLVGIIGRLAYLTRSDGDKYAKRVLAQQTYTSKSIPYKRGTIYDRKGSIIAFSDKTYNLILDVKQMLDGEENEYMEPTISALLECYDFLTREELLQIIEEKPDSQYVILKKELTYDEMMKFEELKEREKEKIKEAKKIIKEEEEGKTNQTKSKELIKGVWFEEDYLRRYPYKTLASNVIGFTTSDNKGNWGIEQYYNDELSGIDGISLGYMDNELNLKAKIHPPTDGNSLVTTIDANVQRIVQDHILKFNEEIGSKNIGVLVMDPNNGEILAMASNKEYDLNKPADLSPFFEEAEIEQMSEEEKMDFLNSIWRNYIISDSFEPGSTFKPFTIAAALEEGKAYQEETFMCDGYEIVGGWTIRCSKRSGHGLITLREALMYSCNDALMQIVQKEGRKVFHDYHTFFGFGSKTGIDLPGEAGGLILSEDKLNASELATSSFGQTFTTTMIQTAAAYSSLINGGNYYKPHLVKQILNEDGAIIEENTGEILKKTVSKKTSDFIKDAMYMTVKEGTATSANVEGYSVSGKTGTAQKQPRSDKTYVVSFIGNVPEDNPKAVIYVVIDEPEKVDNQADSSIATKLTSKILKDILPFLEIYPAADEVDQQEETKAEETQVEGETEAEEKEGDNESDSNRDEETKEEENEFFPDAIPDSNSEEDGNNGN